MKQNTTTIIFPLDFTFNEFQSITLGSLSMQRFWATDGNRKCAVFVFNLSSHYHIYIVEYLFTSRDDYFENLRNTTVLAYEMFTSGCRPWLKNVACLISLLLILIDAGSYLQLLAANRLLPSSPQSPFHFQNEFLVMVISFNFRRKTRLEIEAELNSEMSIFLPGFWRNNSTQIGHTNYG